MSKLEDITYSVNAIKDVKYFGLLFSDVSLCEEHQPLTSSLVLDETVNDHQVFLNFKSVNKRLSQTTFTWSHLSDVSLQITITS